MTPTQEIAIDPVALLKSYCKKHRIHKAALARKMNVNYKYVTNSLKAKYMDIDKIVDFSHALQYNFLRDLAALLPASYPCNDPEIVVRNREIISLKEQVAQLETEKKLFEKILLGKG